MFKGMICCEPRARDQRAGARCLGQMGAIIFGGKRCQPLWLQHLVLAEPRLTEPLVRLHVQEQGRHLTLLTPQEPKTRAMASGFRAANWGPGCFSGSCKGLPSTEGHARLPSHFSRQRIPEDKQ